MSLLLGVFDVLFRYWDSFMVGAMWTLIYSAIAMAGGLVVGVIGVFARRSENPVLRFLAAAYVNLFRNTPLLVQLYLVFFGLPAMGVPIQRWQAAVIALILNNGAYITEILRGGMEGVSRQEILAGYALGMTPAQVRRYVIIPRVIRIAFPGLSNQLMLIVIATSLLSMIGVQELFQRADALEQQTFRSFEIYIASMLIYILITVLLGYLLAVAGRRFLHIQVKAL